MSGFTVVNFLYSANGVLRKLRFLVLFAHGRGSLDVGDDLEEGGAEDDEHEEAQHPRAHLLLALVLLLLEGFLLLLGQWATANSLVDLLTTLLHVTGAGGHFVLKGRLPTCSLNQQRTVENTDESCKEQEGERICDYDLTFLENGA